MTSLIKKASLSLNRVCFKRGTRTILDNVDFSVSQGELVLMTGQNGSGKSTLLKIIAGLLKPQQAQVSFMPHDGQQGSYPWSRLKKLLRRKVCYLHQHPYLFHGSVYDNVAYGLKRQKMSKQEIEQRVVHALQEYSLESLIHRDCHELSGGEKQRVAIVRSWITRPEIILLDEPFSNMDKESRKKSYALIKQMCQQDITIVLTSHDPLIGELSFDQHIHLYQGKITHKSV